MTADPKTFCVLPWAHLEAKPDGQLSACCLSRDALQKENGEHFYLYKDSIEDAYHSKALNQLRKDLLDGTKNPNCTICWQEEAMGHISRRMRENKNFSHVVDELKQSDYSPFQPVYLDLKMGNLCNLKCRICNPRSSSKWITEYTDIYQTDQLSRDNEELKIISAEDSRTLTMSWPENSQFWPSAEKWLPKIEKFEFFGGEPFLNRRHLDLLKLSISKGYSSRQHLHYNTNGTIFPAEAVETIFPHFRHVSIMLSYDGTGAQFEYQRHPAKWKTALENFDRYRKTSVSLEICLTVSALNIYYLPEYLEFWKSAGVRVFLNPLYFPEELSYRCYPREVKDAVAKKFSNYDLDSFDSFTYPPVREQLANMMSADQSALWPKFTKLIQIHDHYRKENFAHVFPEFFEHLKNFWPVSKI